MDGGLNAPDGSDLDPLVSWDSPGNRFDGARFGCLACPSIDLDASRKIDYRPREPDEIGQ